MTLTDYYKIRVNLYGWPNTYVFTKAMEEMLVVNQKDTVPLIIIRPTMITGTNKDPFSGWIEGVRYVIVITHKCLQFVFFTQYYD